MTPTRPWNPPAPTTPPTIAVLSPRQADVLDLLVLGLSNERIARRLWLSENSIKTHMKNILRSLRATDRTHAVVLVYSGAVTVVVKDTSGRAA